MVFFSFENKFCCVINPHRHDTYSVDQASMKFFKKADYRCILPFLSLTCLGFVVVVVLFLSIHMCVPGVHGVKMKVSDLL